jgi:NADH:ubiquinone oxidoreductase subunit H
MLIKKLIDYLTPKLGYFYQILILMNLKNIINNYFLKIFLSISGLLITFIINIILMLVLTIIIASLTLIERKFLSLVQRRVGPNFVGYKGRLQYIADALKLFVKGIIIPDESNKFLFVTIPSIALAICYAF